MSLFGKDTYKYIVNEIDYDKLAQAIVKAEEKKRLKEAEEFRNTKLSWSFRIIIVIAVLVGVFLLLLGIGALALKRYIDALKMLMFLFGDVFLIGASVIIGKTKDKNYIIGLGGLIFSFISIIIAVVTYGG